MKQVIIMLCVAGWCSTCISAATAKERVSASQDVVSLEFVDEHGRVFDIYPSSSGRADVFRAYLEARPGARYSIRARNLSGERVGIVIAVDGRNIISGKRSELDRSESMYVLDPRQSATYSGWRTSADEVRRFYFTNVEDSYASRIGDESAMGVVAAAVYKARPEPSRLWRRQSAAEAAPAIESRDDAGEQAERSAQAGTGFGESEHSRAIRVAFSPVRNPSQRSFFKYEWPEQLCRRGVKLCESTNRFWPEPQQGFVPFPPGDRG